MTPQCLRCDGLVNPLGLGNAAPRLSWAYAAPAQEPELATLEGVRVIVASSRECAERRHGDLWDSGRLSVPPGNAVMFGGSDLASRQQAWWCVAALSNDNVYWSDIACFEIGLRDDSAWEGAWICAPPAPADGVPPPGDPVATDEFSFFRPEGGVGPVIYFCQRFTLGQVPALARLYATALGVYEAYLNGVRVSDRRLAPGWTDYHRRVETQTYDVRPLLRVGENALCLVLADGWYAGHVGFSPKRRGAFYGGRPAVSAQIEVDGAVVLATDERWQAGFGATRSSDLLMGEVRDERLPEACWFEGEPRDVYFYPAQRYAGRRGKRLPERGPPIVVAKTLSVRSSRESAGNRLLLDFGQNLAGVVRVEVHAQPGTRIRLRHGETLDESGQLYTANLRTARAEDALIIGPTGSSVFSPRFTFHGFRYAELVADGPFTVKNPQACLVMSSMERTGWFSCGSDLVNRIFENAWWGQCGNFLSVPTDCPQRDERLGWLGDAQIFVRSAAYNADVRAFFSKWMQDVLDAQRADGAFPDIAPLVIFDNGGAPGWTEAGVIVPWTLWRMYGDRGILRDCYPAMRRLFDYLCEGNDSGIRERNLNLNFGDWLNLDDPAPKELVATAMWARCTRYLIDIADVLGEVSDRELYDSWLRRIRAASAEAFIGDDGAILGGSQGAMVLALADGLVPEAFEERTFARLCTAIETRGYTTCGFLSINALLPLLSDRGRDDLAHALIVREAFPSWGFSVRNGATTIWERWDGWTAERGFRKGMNSFNHYAFGSVVEWLYRYVAGIEWSDRGACDGRLLLQPRPSKTLGSCDATYDSPFGTIGSRWELRGDEVEFEFTVPYGVATQLRLPAGFETTTSVPSSLPPGRTVIAGHYAPAF